MKFIKGSEQIPGNVCIYPGESPPDVIFYESLTGGPLITFHKEGHVTVHVTDWKIWENAIRCAAYYAPHFLAAMMYAKELTAAEAQGG